MSFDHTPVDLLVTLCIIFQVIPLIFQPILDAVNAVKLLMAWQHVP